MKLIWKVAVIAGGETFFLKRLSENFLRVNADLAVMIKGQIWKSRFIRFCQEVNWHDRTDTRVTSNTAFYVYTHISYYIHLQNLRLGCIFIRFLTPKRFIFMNKRYKRLFCFSCKIWDYVRCNLYGKGDGDKDL